MKTKTIKLPVTHEAYTDKYFLRSGIILEEERLNPWVRAQVSIRKGPGIVRGIDEAVEIINRYGSLVENGGKVYGLREGSEYSPDETLLVIESRVRDIIESETMYLGVLSAETTKANDFHEVDINQVRANTARVVEAAVGRPVLYFGARHWRFDEDAKIAEAAYDGGAVGASTDIGAATFGQRGGGTIPHALENVYAWKYGFDRAVVESTKAFDRVIHKDVPRIALIDYANREVDDAVATAHALEGRLHGIRIDTCGENVSQGAVKGNRKYWEGRGVTVTGIYAVRKALDETGFQDVKIVLSSGFADVEKVKAFVAAEKELGVKLFDALGVGALYKSRAAHMDIVAVGSSRDNMRAMAKVGRSYRPNDRLELLLGRER